MRTRSRKQVPRFLQDFSKSKKAEEEPLFLFDSFRLDAANASLRRGKRAIFLTPKAFSVLRYLLEHAGHLVTKDDLWRAVWPGISVTDAALTVCVSEIRKALGDKAKTPRYVETAHRRGYRFVASVSTQAVRSSGSGSGTPAFTLDTQLHAPTPSFVGREAELTKLHEYLKSMLQGERQIAFVTGEPGIGKTALAEAFLHQVAAQESPWIGRGQCIEHYGTGEAYLPLLDALGRLCREPGADRLLAILEQHAPTWLLQMPALLSAAELERLQRKVAGTTHTRMLRELAEAVEAITRERPLVLWLEDLHWSDYSTLEWLSFLARRREPAQLLVLGTYRPVEVIVREHPLKQLKHELQIHGLCKDLPLSLLSQAAVMEYLNLRFASTNSHSAQEPVRKLAQTIYERTDGNPLFMVNVVDYLVAHELPKSAIDWRVPIAADNMKIPSSLVEMIEHNLDRLSRDQQAVLEAASVVGAEFSAAAVGGALDRPISEVEACCTALSRRLEFVRSHGTGEWSDGTVSATFQFLHALYRDLLYDRVPLARRTDIHRRIAKWEEAVWGHRVAEIATEVAHHYTKAGDIRQAIDYLEIAARSAVNRSANREAIAQLHKALEFATTLPVSDDSLMKRVRLQVSLFSPLIATHGYTALEVEKECNRALELCHKIPDSVEQFRVLATLGSVCLNRGQLRIAMELVQQMLYFAKRSDRPSWLLWTHYSMGFIFLEKGDYIHARDHFESCLELYDRKKAGSYGFVQDPGPTALTTLALANYRLGFPDLALKQTSEALELARRISQPFTLAWVLIYSAEILMSRGDHFPASALCEESVALCTKHDLTALLGEALTWRGWGLVECGRINEGIEYLREGIAKGVVSMDEAVGQRHLALALGRNGQIDDALRIIQETLTRESESEMGIRLAWLHQAKGDLLLMQGSPIPAAGCFRQTIDIARAQNDRAHQLTAMTRLARLLVHSDQVRTVLSEIYNGFTEGFDTSDLRQARLVLRQ